MLATIGAIASQGGKDIQLFLYQQSGGYAAIQRVGLYSLGQKKWLWHDDLNAREHSSVGDGFLAKNGNFYIDRNYGSYYQQRKGYDMDGNIIFSRTAEPSNSGTAVDSNGNVFIVGDYLRVTKLDPTGAQVWEKYTSNRDRPEGIMVGVDENILYCTNYGLEKMKSSDGSIMYSSSSVYGMLQWMKLFKNGDVCLTSNRDMGFKLCRVNSFNGALIKSTNLTEDCHLLSLDDKDNVYLYNRNADGSGARRLQKYDSSLNLVWSKPAPEGADINTFGSAYADSKGNVYFGNHRTVWKFDKNGENPEKILTYGNQRVQVGGVIEV